MAELNNYPIEDLKELLTLVSSLDPQTDIMKRWEERLIEAVNDQEFESKQLNF